MTRNPSKGDHNMAMVWEIFVTSALGAAPA